MDMERGPVYIWDLDGTLLDSYGVITGSLQTLEEEFGGSEDPSAILREIKRESVSSLLRRISRERSLPYEKLWERYRKISRSRMDGITLIDGAEEALSRLQGRGGVHFVYTHRGASSQPVLERLGIDHYFRELVTHENGFAPKPSGEGLRYLLDKYGLKPESTWYVGDRQLDMACAADAGVRGILLCPEDSVVEPTGLEDRVIASLWEL